MTIGKDRGRRKKPEYQLKIAKERIILLLNEGIGVYKERPDLTKRYYKSAKKIGMRYNVGMPRELKRKFCKYCFSYLIEGWRFKKGHMYVKCQKCGKILRYPYKSKKNLIRTKI